MDISDTFKQYIYAWLGVQRCTPIGCAVRILLKNNHFRARKCTVASALSLVAVLQAKRAVGWTSQAVYSK